MRIYGCALLSLLLAAGCQRENDVQPAPDADTTTHAAAPAAEPTDAESPEHAVPATDEERIENAMSAAPEAIAREATIVVVDEGGSVRTLREGTGTFTCMPDNPGSPGNDPMCLDANALAWAQAWMAQREPPQGKVGLAYMLRGGSDASNTDPYATEPAAGQQWIDTGPHVMILNATSLMPGYPDQSGDPTRPFVMWPGTPYAHLMVPVK